MSIRVMYCMHRAQMGGAQRRSLWLAEPLRATGVETLVLLPADGEQDYARQLEQAGIPHWREPFPYLRGPRHPVNNLKFLLTLPGTSQRLQRVFAEARADLLHVYGLSNLQPIMAARAAGLPVVWHLNDMLTPKLMVRLLGPYLRHPSVRVAVATPVIAEYYGLTAAGVSTRVFPGVMPPPPTMTADRQPTPQAELGLAADQPLLLCVSNLLPQKGAHDFLTVAGHLLAENARLHAVLIGASYPSQAAYARRIQAQIAALPDAARCHWLGYRDDIARWLAAASILVHPSYSEACPTLVLEGMAAGIPIVATGVGDVPYMLAGMGLTIPAVGDLPTMTEACRTLLSLSDTQRHELSQQLRRRVAESYSQARVIEAYLRAYRELRPQLSLSPGPA